MKVISSYLAFDVEVEGEIFCNGPARIDGTCHGMVHGTEEIMIGTSAHIQGKIRAQSIVVNGSVEGDLSASNKITLLSSGYVKGKFYTPSGGVSIHKGGMLEGSFHIVAPKAALAQEKKKVSSVKSTTP
jgi:cytoskeletal protein CcmA (bactofilin family)